MACSASDLLTTARTFFQKLFTSSAYHVAIDDLNFSNLSASDIFKLEQPFTITEIENALRSLPNTKAPGPDGKQGIFHKCFWSCMKFDILRLFYHLYQNSIDSSDLNFTYLVLIPKVQSSLLMIDFRPISLCNIIYKLFAKVLSNRLCTVPYL